MSGFFDFDFGKALERKYDILQQDANSGTTTSNAQMMNAQTARSGMPSEIKLREANASNLNMQTEWMPEINRANIRQSDAAAGFNVAQTDKVRRGLMVAPDDWRRAQAFFQGLTDEGSLTPISGGMSRPQDLASQYTLPLDWRDLASGAGYAKGTARVPGKGSGKVDKVPAKLAPGEAVLNKAAAEMMGRGLIAKLNAKGAAKMGMV